MCLTYADADRDKGEKGQEKIRYNVNGILLENAAFAKLETEVKLRKVSATIWRPPRAFALRSYTKMLKVTGMILLSGKAVLAYGRTMHIIRGDGNAEPYYEVVTNGKVISMLRDKLKSNLTVLVFYCCFIARLRWVFKH